MDWTTFWEVCRFPPLTLCFQAHGAGSTDRLTTLPDPRKFCCAEQLLGQALSAGLHPFFVRLSASLSLFLQAGLSVAQAGLELPSHNRTEFELPAPLDCIFNALGLEAGATVPGLSNILFLKKATKCSVKAKHDVYRDKPVEITVFKNSCQATQ